MQRNSPLVHRSSVARDARNVDRDLENTSSGTSQNVVGHGDNYNGPVFGRFVGGRHNITIDNRRFSLSQALARESFVVDPIAMSTQPHRQPRCLIF